MDETNNQNNESQGTNIPVMDVQPTQQSTGEDTPSQPTDTQPTLSIPQSPVHPKKNAPSALVVVVVILALVLAGGAVYMYMNSNKETATPATTTPVATKVTGSDVNDTKDEVEKAVSELDDAKDLNADDLSDTTLGL